MFSAQFKPLVHDIVPNDAQRLATIREMLGPNVRACIAETFNSPELYHAALRELYRKYGDAHLVTCSHVDDLLDFSRLITGRPYDLTTLAQLSDRLHTTVVTLDTGGYQRDLHSSAVLRQVVQALPDNQRRACVRQTFGIRPRFPSLRNLDSFLERAVEEEAAVSAVKPVKEKKETKGHPDGMI